MNIPKRLSLFVTILLLLLGSVTCVTTPESSTKVARPYLWKVAREGRVHHVLGTMHVGVDARQDLGPEVWQAFEAAPCLVVEADQKAIDFGQLYSMSRLPKGQLLSAQMQPDAWKKLNDKLGSQAGDTLNTSQPWFATLLLLQELTPSGEAMDYSFVQAALQKKKRVEFLEDWREAIGAFAQVTDVADLEDLLNNEQSAKDDTQAMMDAYRSGDASRLEQVIADVNGRTPGSDAKLAVLLAGRNAIWLPRLLKSLEKDSCFVAVGVGHLVGPKNLFDLLRAKGFTVERAAPPI